MSMFSLFLSFFGLLYTGVDDGSACDGEETDCEGELICWYDGDDWSSGSTSGDCASYSVW